MSLTLPCVVGPYTTISCTLRLLKNSIRINTTNGDNGYAHNTGGDGLPTDDSRFIENNIPVKAIAASNAQNDSGVFELSFRDERYLPFEGAGAIANGRWSFSMTTVLTLANPYASLTTTPSQMPLCMSNTPPEKMQERLRTVQLPIFETISAKLERHPRCACSTYDRISQVSGIVS